MTKIANNKNKLLDQNISWGELFDNALKIIPKATILNDYKIYFNTEKEVINFYLKRQTTTTLNDFIKRSREVFLSRISENYHDAAFANLQKHLPTISEHLILTCYKSKILDINTFSKTFLNLYVYAKKGNTLFSTVIKPLEILEIFKYCNRNILMNIGERNKLKHFSSELQIYRGVAGKSESKALQGISWTINREIADGFGKYDMDKFGLKSYDIIEAKISKEFVFAYIHSTGRYEDEIIIDPSKIFEPKIIKTFANTV